ncbi:integrase-like protein [Cytobacillus firmus]|uniref:Integrase-like protein n=2 Tax=Cytobacillus TaxID=2675230 RepID=A0A366JND8_CYTFI|nr:MULTISPECIES: phage integrase N-terminal SAM-like domain-containing protein [Cytobacillus]RBP87860.1 integrase-like protein [Cytobacillus firmus]TDX39223.1 integrase-like protein [Cytobacillus oceanisediminis]
MPYGFIKHIENKGYSEETVNSYEKVINQFFAFIKDKYPDNKEPFQITSSDIIKYLEYQRDIREKSISTINKELAILKTMFNYFWETDKVPLSVDPAVKIKRFVVKEKPTVHIQFHEILKVLDLVLLNDEYSPLRKVLFLLATKGLKMAEFGFTKDKVKDNANKDIVEIQLKNRTITLQGSEVAYFHEYFYSTFFNGSEYVFTTKHHGENVTGPIQVMSMQSHLRAISRDYLPEGSPALTLTIIRRAIAFDLYSKKVPIQLIAAELGIEENTASYYLKQIVEGTYTQKELE